jgi:large subunit ribosomal protein L6
VNTGFKKTLLIEGVGFRAELKGTRLSLSLGYSHPILVIPPVGIEFQTPSQTSVVISGQDKQLVGEVASKLRDLRPPEPYKGKGVRYEGEVIRRKAGKSSSK